MKQVSCPGELKASLYRGQQRTQIDRQLEERVGSALCQGALDAELLKQPQNALRAGVVQMMHGNHRITAARVSAKRQMLRVNDCSRTATGSLEPD
jgi:hypothetical protein